MIIKRSCCSEIEHYNHVNNKHFFCFGLKGFITSCQATNSLPSAGIASRDLQ